MHINAASSQGNSVEPLQAVLSTDLFGIGPISLRCLNQKPIDSKSTWKAATGGFTERTARSLWVDTSPLTHFTEQTTVDRHGFSAGAVLL